MMKVAETEIGLNSRQHGTLLAEEEIASLKKLFTMSVYGTGAEEGTYGNYETFVDAAIKLLAEKAGVSWGSNAHTCVNVPVYAIGPGAEKFSGYIDNTEIPKLIGQLMGISQ
jgi:alkaline phosphatase